VITDTIRWRRFDQYNSRRGVGSNTILISIVYAEKKECGFLRKKHSPV
jgi:hypothetical protein